MDIDSLRKLYIHELKDLYSAENQLLKALPKLHDAASDKKLKKALESHLKETERHVQRLESIFEKMNHKPGGSKCAAMAGLVEEGQDAINEPEDADVRDAAIIAACQRVEHYEIAGYGTAAAFGEQLGEYAAVDKLHQTLDEEAAADVKLSRIARRSINFEAMAGA